MLCTYVVKHDYGFAPNPYWGFCTLAACTPNHQGVELANGDWIAGHSPKDTGRRLIYAMKVSEVLDYNDYFVDRRFRAKRPRLTGTWNEQCGDNIYYQRGRTGDWKQLGSAMFHRDDAKRISQDTKYHRVYVAERFIYLGENAEPIPKRFSGLLRDRCGSKKRHDKELSDSFVKWICRTFRPGIHGDPGNLDEWASNRSTRN